MGNVVPVNLYCRLLTVCRFVTHRIGRRRHESPSGGAIVAPCNTTRVKTPNLPGRKSGKNDCQTVCVGRTASENVSVATNAWLSMAGNHGVSLNAKAKLMSC